MVAVITNQMEFIFSWRQGYPKYIRKCDRQHFENEKQNIVISKISTARTFTDGLWNYATVLLIFPSTKVLQ